MPTAMIDDALRLLRDLSGPHGIAASGTATANYQAVFARDAVIAGIAGVMAHDDVVVDGFARSLDTLRRHQGAEGQIASNVTPGSTEADGGRASFGSLAPRFDAATWYLVGIAVAARAHAIDASAFQRSVSAVIALLNGIEYNGRGLLYVPVGGNWADEYIYDGYILYDQILRAWALRQLGATYDEPRWRAKADQIEDRIAASYWPENASDPDRPIASFTPTGARDIFDLAACALLGVSGMLSARADTALAWITRTYLDHHALPPAFAPVIDEGDAEWPALRAYHLHGFRNRPYEYHNGGIWPVWLGWLALACARAGRERDVEQLRDGLASRLHRGGGWRFEEYLHGRTGVPGGTPHMAFSAAGIVLLHHASPDNVARVLG